MSKSLYLRVEPGDIASCVLLTGDPARVDHAADLLSDSRVIARNREFYTLTGSYQGRSFSVVSSGIGAPSAAIAIEELVQLGARAIVRVGTTMGIDLPMGCFVAASGAARFEGTSRAYLGAEFPAVPDWDLTHHLLDAGDTAHQDVRLGVTATYDAFYPKMAPALVSRGLPDLELLRQAQVIAVDMETSALFITALRLRVAAAALCLVTNSADPFGIIESALREQREADLLHIALSGLLAWRSIHE